MSHRDIVDKNKNKRERERMLWIEGVERERERDRVERSGWQITLDSAYIDQVFVINTYWKE